MRRARWPKVIPRRFARSPTSGLSPATSPPRIRIGSLSRPKLRISWYSPKLLLPLAAIVATIPLLIWWWWSSVDERAIRLEPISFSAIEGWTADDQAAAFPALIKSCRKKPSASSACKDALALGDKVDRDAARRFFETHYIAYRVEQAHAGMVTAYYEPELNGSRERTDKFQ